MKKILVINSGSSSLKFQLFQFAHQKEQFLCKGVIERIGKKEAQIMIKWGSALFESATIALPHLSYTKALYALYTVIVSEWLFHLCPLNRKTGEDHHIKETELADLMEQIVKNQTSEGETSLLNSSAEALVIFKKVIYYWYDIGFIEEKDLSDLTFIHNQANLSELNQTFTLVDEQLTEFHLEKDSLTEFNISIRIPSLVDAIGHRVVHGGEHFSQSVRIDDRVKAAIKSCIPLAPLHNPFQLEGINRCEQLFQGTPQVAVFDTAFHQTMPKESFLYAIPLEFYEKHGVRRYGFHGTSYQYVYQELEQFSQSPSLQKKLIICHLGNGASLVAIQNGKVVDTSMGMTPLEGLVMGTRAGDLDVGILAFLVEEKKIPFVELIHTLQHKSGLLALSQIGSDMREIETLKQSGHEQATFAFNLFCQRLTKTIGAYIAIMNGCDSIIFTGGIGENSAQVREQVLSHFTYLNIAIDPEKNQQSSKQNRIISVAHSSTPIYVIPTDEEKMIARDTFSLLGSVHWGQA